MKWNIEIFKDGIGSVGYLVHMKTGKRKWFKSEENALKECKKLNKHSTDGYFKPIREDLTCF